MMDNDPSVQIGLIQVKHTNNAATTPLTVQSAKIADAPRVIETIAGAFLNDPTWSWAFPDPALRKQFWRPSVEGALRYPWVFKTSNFESVSVWIPPHRTEYSPADVEKLPELLMTLAGSRASQVAELLRRFDESHPHAEPHYYLSLLGTRAEHRGRGIGVALLKENLARIDAEHMPAYLESSNPANNRLYESVGFVTITSFRAPGDDGPQVTGMWRKANTG